MRRGYYQCESCGEEYAKGVKCDLCVCNHKVPLDETIGCKPCFQAALDGAMDQAKRGSACHVRAGAPFIDCTCELCDALRQVKSLKDEVFVIAAMVNPKYGYHTVKIKKGALGETSKVQEELDELIDAEKQGVKILIAVELSDLYGALRAVAVKHGYKMADLHDMAKLTRRAFEQGHRK